MYLLIQPCPFFIEILCTQSMQSLRNLLGSNEGEPTSEAGAYEHHGTLEEKLESGSRWLPTIQSSIILIKIWTRTMYCDDKVYPDLRKPVHHGEGVLHPVGEENVPDVALLRLARALVVIHHAGVVVHVTIPGHNIISSAISD